MSAPLQISPVTKDIGFLIRRLLPNSQVKSIGPFVFWDHMGPAHFAHDIHRKADVRPHPHIGLATVTYLLAGGFMHRDSLGNVQRINPFDLNIMKSGSGIVHSERIPDDIRQSDAEVRGLQIWIALPEELEVSDPSFYHYDAKDLPHMQEEGLQVTVLIGEGFGLKSPAIMFSPTQLIHVKLPEQFSFDWRRQHPQQGIYIINGDIQINGKNYPTYEMLEISDLDSVTITALTDTELLIFGGATLDKPRILWWNFVSSDQTRLDLAKQRWKDGQFPPIPGEIDFIPLPP
jgi:redox-sensitive bicupin YhaK (pirin superfamily)